MRPDGIGPGSTGNIEVGPLCLVHELLNKNSAHDSPGLAARADVLDVRDIGFDQLAVFRAERELPKALARLVSVSNDLVDQPLVIAHDARIYVSEGDDDRAGERGHIHDS